MVESFVPTKAGLHQFLRDQFTEAGVKNKLEFEINRNFMLNMMDYVQNPQQSFLDLVEIALDEVERDREF
jgi:hypothetical protein